MSAGIEQVKKVLSDVGYVDPQLGGVTSPEKFRTYLTRSVTFSAAHRLYDDAMNWEENRKVFGKCVNIHGHNFKLEATFYCDIQVRSKYGMEVNISKVGDILNETVYARFDHIYLNDHSFFKNINPTCENILLKSWQMIECEIAGSEMATRLHRLVLHETEKNVFVYNGEKFNCIE